MNSKPLANFVLALGVVALGTEVSALKAEERNSPSRYEVEASFGELATAPEKYDGKVIRLAAFVKGDVYGNVWLFKRWKDANHPSSTAAKGKYVPVAEGRFALKPTPPTYPLRADVVGMFKMNPKWTPSMLSPGYLVQIDALKIYYLSDKEMNDLTMELK